MVKEESTEPPPLPPSSPSHPPIAVEDSTKNSDRIRTDQELESSESSTSFSSSSNNSTLNAGAPEFVPRSSSFNRSDSPRLVMHSFSGPPPPPPTSPLFHVPYQTYGVVGGAGGAGFVKQEMEQSQSQSQSQQLVADLDHASPTVNGLSHEVRHKILNQVEYYFSDVNLATTDHLIKFISKDPDGFVPISVVASFKKIKALVSSHIQLAAVLRKSSKLVISDDGKKVRRQHPLTESDMEDLQSRIVIAENLPEDHSYQNLMKVFSAVGSVKTIRTCQPQISNGVSSGTARSSKADNILYSNKLHAFVEYETVEIAEKAVIELNDERDWRSGLRLRILLNRTSKSVQNRGKKFGHEGEVNTEDDDLSTSEQLTDKRGENHSQPSDLTSHEHNVEENIHEKEGNPRRGRGRGRGGKGRGRGHGHGQHPNNRGSHVGTPPASYSIHSEQSTATRQPPGPRMPDGTKGFTMGRGRPVVASHVI